MWKQLLIVMAVSAGSLGVTAAPANPAPSRFTWSNGSSLPSDTLLGCRDKPVDIYFLLDCSSSVWIVDFDKQKEFVISLIQHFDIHPNATRVGLGAFSDDFYHVVDIGEYNNKDLLTRAIRSAPYFSGNTYTDRALKGMRTHGFRSQVVRPNVTKIGVVITDGRSRYRTNTAAEAAKAREEHIWLFAIGVGERVDEGELRAIASVPKENFTFHVASFDILSTLTHTLAISTCNVHKPQADGAACGRQQAGDVMIVFHAASLGRVELGQVQAFITHLVQHFSTATGNIRVGLLSQGQQGQDVQLGQYPRGQDFIRALLEQPRVKLSPLFKKLRHTGFDTVHGGRYNAKKLVIAFVDDAMQDSNDVIYEALLLKYEKAVIHVVALGDTYKLDEVKQVASSPNFITQLGWYGDLDKPKTRQDFLRKFCDGL